MKKPVETPVEMVFSDQLSDDDRSQDEIFLEELAAEFRAELRTKVMV
jgi:hypothetical protein